ncbi:MAG: hypothetical protein ACHQHN_03735 [Sphingobacteriales bacterium]
MTKFILRITLLTLLACFTAVASKAQIGFDYSQYDLGTSLGFNSFAGDVQTSTSTKAINFNFDYNQTPFVNYIFEFQAGKLGGGNENTDLLGRQFSADYNYYAFRIQVQAGELIDYSQSPFLNAVKNLYVGAGVGMIYSNISPNNINRYSILSPGYYTPGTDKANELFVPARIGYELKIFNKNQRPDVKIDVGYQYNIVMGDQLDGFKAGTHNDAYGQFTIGVKISVGGVTSYGKQISY